MASYVITGASRGIGLELVTQLLRKPASQVGKIFAVTRTPSSAIKDLATGEYESRIANIVAELNDPKAAGEVESALDGYGLDYLVNNAGILPSYNGTIDKVPVQHLTDAFNVNVVGVHLVTAAFLPLLRKGQKKTVINVSSTLGSNTWSAEWGSYAMAYRVSKSAVNMVNSLYSHEFKDEGFTFLLISPGWLKTDLGSQYADLEKEVGVGAVVRLIEEANPSQTGQFRNINIPGYHIQEGPKAYIGQQVPF